MNEDFNANLNWKCKKFDLARCRMKQDVQCRAVPFALIWSANTTIWGQLLTSYRNLTEPGPGICKTFLRAAAGRFPPEQGSQLKMSLDMSPDRSVITCHMNSHITRHCDTRKSETCWLCDAGSETDPKCEFWGEAYQRGGSRVLPSLYHLSYHMLCLFLVLYAI